MVAVSTRERIETAASAKVLTGVFNKLPRSTSYQKRIKLLALGSTYGIFEVIMMTLGHVAFHGKIKGYNF